MKKIKFLAAMCITFSAAVVAQAQSFQIEISNIQTNKGKVFVAIYNSKADWFDKPYREIAIQPSENAKLVSFEVPYGVYAVSVYQDVKANNKLDRNFLGIPTEPIAFGNNYEPFGKPKFESAAVNFNENYKVQKLKLYKAF